MNSELPDRVSTAIIGGGAIGVTIAYYLAQMGHDDFVLLESDYLGRGSTGRCGTGIRAQFACEPNIVTMKKSEGLWGELSERLSFDFYQTGYLYLAYSESELNRLKRLQSLQNSLGIPTELVEPVDIGQLCKIVDLDQVVGGAYNPSDGKATPFQYLLALSRQVEKHGDHLVQGVTVTDIDRLFAGQLELQTDIGESVQADRIVNAAGANASKVGDMLGESIPVEPVKHQATITEPVAEGTVDPMVVSLTHNDVYFTQTEAGGVIGGVSLDQEHITHDTTETAEFIQLVSRAFTEVAPPLGDLGMVRSWGGHYVTTPDSNPMIGSYRSDRHYVAAGFSGHGYMMAPVVGSTLAKLLLGKDIGIDIEFYDPTRFDRGELRDAALQMG